jgi:kynurenine formamidase
MSTKWIYLSHVLSDKTPGYGGKPHFKVTPASEISCGHSSNSGIWEFRNHMGTHMDAPKHFVDSGKTMDSYEASEWVYSKTCLVKIQAQADLLILPEHVSEQIQKDCELLLIKTGWEKFRTETKYWEHNPGL